MYNQNGINKLQQVPVQPIANSTGQRQGTAFHYGPFRGHGLNDQWLSVPTPVDHNSKIVASITELGLIDDPAVMKPFQGAASMEVLNIVPQDDNTVRVRVYIYWDSDLWYRISIINFW